MTGQLQLLPDDPDAPALRRIGLVMHRSVFARVGLDDVSDDIPWQQHYWSMYGQTGKRPRKECWYHDDPTRGYEFGGGAPVKPARWTPLVHELGTETSALIGERFDSCFANRYRDGQDMIDWHADDDSWIGPVIASLSFGATRTMRFRRKQRGRGERSLAVELHHGDLLVMPAGTQEIWEHSIPRKSGNVGPRVNLTFRQTRRATR